MRLDPYSNLLAGSVGGAAGLFVGYPFDTVKVINLKHNSQIQSLAHNFFDAFPQQKAKPYLSTWAKIMKRRVRTVEIVAVVVISIPRNKPYLLSLPALPRGYPT